MKTIFTLAFFALSFSNANAQATTPPYTQDFTTFPPAGWSFGSEGDVTTGPTSTYNEWAQAPFLADTSHNDASIRVELYTTNRKLWAISNAFDLSGGDYKVSFDYGAANSAFSSTPSGPPPTVACDDEFKFLISTDGGTSWQELKSWTSPNSVFTNTASTYTYDLTNYTGNNVKFAFYAYDGAVYNWQADYRIYIDNFKVTKEDLATSDINKTKTSLYPNPTPGKVNINSSKTVKSIEVYNTGGRLISRGNNIDLTSVTNGVYPVKIYYTDGTVSTDKVIKK
ncbi:T9SS type A sorting domain-containing protein [Epilithonimonas sp.]|uniref:T9SS type A sorting domain-containing protein n=1 Tax=Epilithonimonas sp. TaxID=2894511 RepID=UPI0028A62590|nr:T9SS type A sorting domain-containing protein [Epilithonimonas sp.]